LEQQLSEIEVKFGSVVLASLPASQLGDARPWLENTPAQLSLSGLPLIVSRSDLEASHWCFLIRFFKIFLSPPRALLFFWLFLVHPVMSLARMLLFIETSIWFLLIPLRHCRFSFF
jgi:hypothetical protein